MTQCRFLEDSGVDLMDDDDGPRHARADSHSTVRTASTADSSVEIDTLDLGLSLDHPRLDNHSPSSTRLNPTALARLPTAARSEHSGVRPCRRTPPPVLTARRADSPVWAPLRTTLCDDDDEYIAMTACHPQGSGSSSTPSSSTDLQQRGRLPASASAGAVTVTNEPIAAYRQRVVNVARRWKISLADAAELCDNIDDAQHGPGMTDAGSAAAAAGPRRVVAKPRPRRVAVRLLAVPLVNEAGTYGAHRVYKLDICDPVTWESYQTFSIRYSKLRAAMLGSDKLWAGAVPTGRFPGKGLFTDYTFDKANACSRGESIRLYLEAVLNADDDGAILGASQLHTALGVDRYGQRALLEVAVARSGAGIFCPMPGTDGGGVILSPGPATAAVTSQTATVVPQPEHGFITPAESPPAAL